MEADRPGTSHTPELTPREALGYAAAAQRNAASLLRDAEFLLDRRRYPRAASLAIIGREEAGKALMLMLVALGRIKPDKLGALLKQMRRGPRSHSSKQAVSLVPALLGVAVARMMPLLRRKVNALLKNPPAKSFQETMVELVERLRPELIASLQAVMPTDAEFKADVDAVGSGSWQRVRDAGLYVDFKEGVVGEPRSINARVARSHVEALRQTLKGLRLTVPSPNISEDVLEALRRNTATPADEAAVEAMWAEGLATLRRRRARSRRSR